ncbi:MAG: septum formation inhibitor Maf [Coriobacteriales bacterium]|nr:septum formation inhibitor Maf [Coriobacteriales bacterium]
MILASKSPRRKQLLLEAGFDFTCIPSDFDESSIKLETPSLYVQDLAKGKALTVSSSHPEEVVIGSDTIVVLEDTILGKPKDAQDAFRMLSLLSGNTHIVYTGVCIAQNSQVLKSFVSATNVTFWPLSNEEINAYIQSGDPLDKAGSYGIQTPQGRLLIRSINGDYYTVIGLPLGELVRSLKDLNISTSIFKFN